MWPLVLSSGLYAPWELLGKIFSFLDPVMLIGNQSNQWYINAFASGLNSTLAFQVYDNQVIRNGHDWKKPWE